MLFGSGNSDIKLDENGHVKPLGFIAQSYESANHGPGVIADVPGDGGGKAYGSYQLDSHFKHLVRYIEQSDYSELFEGLKPGSEEFDKVWKTIAETDGKAFELSQRSYVTKAYYHPAAKFAKSVGFDTTSRAVQEAIFSIALQHGSWKTVLRIARKQIKLHDPKSQIESLYGARKAYVQALAPLSPKVKRALATRYVLEEQDVQSLLT